MNIPKTMRAMLLTEQRQPLKLAEVPVPVARAGAGADQGAHLRGVPHRPARPGW